MRRSLSLSPLSALLNVLLILVPFTSAERLIESRSLTSCMDNSSFSATLFNVVFTPDNKTLTFEINGVSTITGNVTADLRIIAYGFRAFSQKLNPCDNPGLAGGLCPMNTGPINLPPSNIPLSDDVIRAIPSIAYNIPDIDGRAQVWINDTKSGKALACVEAELSNGKTVYQKAVGWVTAIIAGIGLIASAVTSGLGHSNTAAHVAANALSLFGFFQAQALMGMTAVPLPPIVGSWTQNFQWSMGIIRVEFLQDMATWYQRATGGTPSRVLSTLAITSVDVQKRSVEVVNKLFRRAFEHMLKRSNNDNEISETTRRVTLRGMERVGFRAGIEPTNIFFTGYCFFIIFVILVVICVSLFKVILDTLVKTGKMGDNKFQEFRTGWLTVLKGILFRIVLIGFPQMSVLCFYELTRRDSAAEVALAVLTIMTMLAILGWAAFKVVGLARKSILQHKNPAYILYSDPNALNRWGFLYVQFKATAYFFVIPVLVYTLVKGLFVGVAQSSGVAQAIALVLLEAAMLVGLSVLRPYMDKKTNGFNIAIVVIQFISSIFLLVFSNVFNQPDIVTGVLGVAFFIINVVFAFILLIMVLVSSCLALFSKNPDTRYQPMRDDRGSFIKSQTQLNPELDALGATARGEKGASRSRLGDDDAISYSSASSGLQAQKEANAMNQTAYRDDPRSPNSYYNPAHRSASPNPYQGNYQQYSRPSSGYRQANNASPWQRGAGYDH